MKRVDLQSAASQPPLAPQAHDDLCRHFLHHSPQGVFLADECGRYLQVNPAAVRLAGYTEAELLTMSVTDLVPPESAEAGRRHFATVVQEGRALGEMRFRKKNGELGWWLVEAIKLSDTRLLGFCTDITERKQTEQNLLEAEWKFRALFEKGPIGVAYHRMVYDDAGKPVDYFYVDANERFLELTGVDPRGKLVTAAFPGIEKDPADWIGTFGRVAQTGVPVRFEQYLQTNGRWYDCVGYQYQPDHFVAAFLDITKRKKAEQALAQLNAQLQSKNKELEQVVYVASHDLRSPLVNIDGYGREVGYAVDALKQLLGDDAALPEAVRAAVRTQLQDMTEALRYIRGSAAHMDTLLTGLLKLSRLGRAALTIVPLDMDRLLAELVAAFEFQIRETGVQCLVTPLPRCLGDAVQVSQVFRNLLSNALKYLDPARPGVIRISGLREWENVVYCVEDNGIGIDPAHQANIFEVFHRLEPTKSPGEGLGLAIVRQAVGRLAGQVRVVSALGEGSRFFVTLPGDQV